MRYFEIAPTERLSRLVDCYWYLEKEYGFPQPEGEWIFPDGTTDLVFQRTGRFFADGVRLPTNFFVGPRNRPLLLCSQGRAAAVGVRFLAHGAYPFSQQPLNALSDQVVELKILAGRSAPMIEDRVSSSTPLQAIAALECFLLDKLSFHGDLMGRMYACLGWLEGTSGTAPISDLASHVNLSPRQLERCFRLTTGLAPKQLARIYRFDAVRNRLMLQPGEDLTALAHSCQYHDQAHFIHEFRDLAGFAPRGFAREMSAGTIAFNK